MKKLTSKLEQINATLINQIIFWIGLGVVFIGLFIQQSDWRNICISVGCSLIASSIVSYLTSKYLIRINTVKNIIEHWGLVTIYETRQEMNRKSDEIFPSLEKHLDIIAWGLKSFRDSSKGRMIEDKIKQGLKVRIIAPHPDSKFVVQREHDEKEIPGQIRKTIIHLGEWVNNLKKSAHHESDVQIRYYESLPEDFFFRMDDHVFIGPYRYGISSQQTISYEFKGPSNGFRNYVDYFERVWGDESFCK